MRISLRRSLGAVVCALSLSAGCGSKKDATKLADSGESTLCQEPECARGADCGCAGMDAGCTCERCQQEGACHATSGSCEPASDDDCNRPGGACEVYGFCHVGMTSVGPRCLAQSDEDCRGSWLCAQWGDCSYVPELQQCAAGSAEDCAASAACREAGCCSLLLTECYKSDGSCPYDC